MFRALMVEKGDDGVVSAAIRNVDDAALPDGDTTVAVEYSTINYKDGLAINNKSGVIRSFPMVPGVDFTGRVSAGGGGDCGVGTAVTLTRLERRRVALGWPRAKGARGVRVVGPVARQHLDERAAAIGTAGFTAMLCVLTLEEHAIAPQSGPVVVTGAAGGVGSVAVALLARLGYEVHAVTGRPGEADYLQALGAKEIIDRAELSGDARPLAKMRWAGGIDAVGSKILANVLSMTKENGCIAACGLAQGMDLPGSVAPFILRGVTLAGVNSVTVPYARRVLAWQRLARDLDPATLDSMTTVVGLDDAITIGLDILQGKVRGRVVVDVNA